MSHFLGGAKGVVNKFSRHTTKPFEIIKLKKSQIKEAQKEKLIGTYFFIRTLNFMRIFFNFFFILRF